MIFQHYYEQYFQILHWIQQEVTFLSTTITTTKCQLHWSPWTPCPPCGGGTKLRINSEGQTEERGCSTQPCSQPLWSPWSPCSTSCGPGSKTRINSENKVERKDCNLEQCHTKSKLKGKKLTKYMYI